MKRNHYYMFIKHVKHVLQQNSLPLYSVSNSNTKQLRVKTLLVTLWEVLTLWRPLWDGIELGESHQHPLPMSSLLQLLPQTRDTALQLSHLRCQMSPLFLELHTLTLGELMHTQKHLNTHKHIQTPHDHHQHTHTHICMYIIFLFVFMCVSV